MKLERNKNQEREAKRRAGGPHEAGYGARTWRRCMAGRRRRFLAVRSRRIARLFDGLIDPGTDRRHHPIPQSWYRLDVSRLLGVVAEQTAERCHSLVDGVGRDVDLRPDLVEQGIDADGLPGVLGQAQQQSHSPRLYPSGLSIS